MFVAMKALLDKPVGAENSNFYMDDGFVPNEQTFVAENKSFILNQNFTKSSQLAVDIGSI